METEKGSLEQGQEADEVNRNYKKAEGIDVR
jgi:hypothetical protein